MRNSTIELAQIDNEDYESEPLLSSAEPKLLHRTEALLDQIERNRHAFSTWSLFLHNFLFEPIFYCEAAYLAFLNYTEALALTYPRDTELLKKLEILMQYLPLIGVLSPEAEYDFMQALDSVFDSHNAVTKELYFCVQHDERINQDAMHPVVVYFFITIAAVTLISAPFVFSGLFALMAVFSAIFLLAEMGPSSRVFDIMVQEENRCCDTYEKSLGEVYLARTHFGLFGADPLKRAASAELDHEPVKSKTC